MPTAENTPRSLFAPPVLQLGPTPLSQASAPGLAPAAQPVARYSHPSKAEDVDGFEAEGLYDLDHIVGPDGEGAWNGARGGTDADVVDEEDGVARGDGIEREQVPEVHRAAEVHVEDEEDVGGRKGYRRGGTRSGWRR